MAGSGLSVCMQRGQAPRLGSPETSKWLNVTHGALLCRHMMAVQTIRGHRQVSVSIRQRMRCLQSAPPAPPTAAYTSLHRL